MIIKLRKKYLWLFPVAILLIISAVFLPYGKIINAMSNSGKYDFENNTIVIDPGHGGVDPGAIGINKCIEKDINLNIALTLRDILIANGYNVVMTRESDVGVHDEKYTKISKIKTSDLKNRLKLIEDNEDAIAIMIHQNHFVGEKYHGAQMFYGRINPNSKLLAESLRKCFMENLQPENKRVIKQSTKDVYILHNAKNPIVLAECGFLSNYNEAELLCDSEYQQKVAFTIFCGIEEYKKELEKLKETKNP